jgi:hypothetical protein
MARVFKFYYNEHSKEIQYKEQFRFETNTKPTYHIWRQFNMAVIYVKLKWR